MSAPKFTPGPWVVGGATAFVNQLSIEPCIGAVYGAGEEVKANAHLIAAAPELYSALKMVLDDPTALDGRPRTYKYVQNALAKARGEA